LTNLPEYNIQLELDSSSDRHHYNLLTTQEELTAIIPSDIHPHANSREIIIQPREGRLMRMSECHPAFFSMHFPLLSPSGQ